MKVFVTGGSGFIGERLVRSLVGRGDEVYALVRSPGAAEKLSALGARPVLGDITEPETLRAALAGIDLVFHVAAWYKLGSSTAEAERINVTGTRNVLSLAYDAGVSKIIYTSTVAVFGDTSGQLVDEAYRMPAGRGFLTEYDRTKWLAHYAVALPLIEQGAPIVIVQPGGVYGPGDHSLVGDLMARYLSGRLPFPLLTGPELTLTYAHVDDIVAGHLLAAELGQPGQTYILAGPALSMAEAVQVWSQVTGKRPPLLSIPARFLVPFAPLVELVQKVVPLPPIFGRDSLAILQATYMARSDKAHRELGWRARPVEAGFRQTFEWLADQPRPAQDPRRRILVGLALGAAAGVAVTWLLRRRR